MNVWTALFRRRQKSLPHRPLPPAARALMAAQNGAAPGTWPPLVWHAFIDLGGIG